MNWVFENNFKAGFTPFSSLLVFKDFVFCLFVLPACRRLLFPLLQQRK